MEEEKREASSEASVHNTIFSLQKTAVMVSDMYGRMLVKQRNEIEELRRSLQKSEADADGLRQENARLREYINQQKGVTPG